MKYSKHKSLLAIALSMVLGSSISIPTRSAEVDRLSKADRSLTLPRGNLVADTIEDGALKAFVDLYNQLADPSTNTSKFLSEADRKVLFAWIANETSAEKAPYCYRRSYGRGVGTVPTEVEPDRVKIGALSYSQCRPGTKRVGVDCHSVCPDGMRDDGLFCRAAEYGRGAGYTLFASDKCNRENGQGCERCLALLYPKCRPGYSPVGCNICRPNKPDCNALGLAGGLDLSCAKKVIVGDAKPLVCNSGRENDAGLCYPTCRGGFYGVGPVCYQSCSSGKVNCGAGCASSTATCTTVTTGQVFSAGKLVYSLYTLGTTGAAETAAQAAAKTGGNVLTGNAGGRAVNVKVRSVLVPGAKEQSLAKVKNAATIVFTKLKNPGTARIALATAREGAALQSAINDFTNIAAADLEDMTTANVAKTLREKFGENGAKAIAKGYASQSLLISLSEFGIDTGRALATFDPTGISGVIAAYSRPLCDRNQPFPNITVLSKE